MSTLKKIAVKLYVIFGKFNDSRNLYMLITVKHFFATDKAFYETNWAKPIQNKMQTVFFVHLNEII